jgi:hypothetical protein
VPIWQHYRTALLCANLPPLFPKEVDSLKINKQLRWGLRAGLTGIAAAAVLVVLFRFTQNRFILWTLLSANRLGAWIAFWATGVVFPGDRISYSLISAPEFFDFVFVLVAGLQTALIGACVGFILNRRSSRNA